MRQLVRFTELEEKELRSAMKESGIFLKLFSNQDEKVEVLARDGEGLKTIRTFDRIISDKIYALYNNQDEYKAPLEAGYRQVSISWFIATYC